MKIRSKLKDNNLTEYISAEIAIQGGKPKTAVYNASTVCKKLQSQRCKKLQRHSYPRTF
jgi:hypothetical protein